MNINICFYHLVYLYLHYKQKIFEIETKIMTKIKNPKKLFFKNRKASFEYEWIEEYVVGINNNLK